MGRWRYGWWQCVRRYVRVPVALCVLTHLSGGPPPAERVERSEGGRVAPGPARRASTGQPTGQPVPPLALQDATVIDVTTGRRLPHQTLVIVGTRIRTIGPARTTRVPPGATVVDARGKYVIPGLWDMHVHGSGLKSYQRLVLAGITGFRNAAVDARNMGTLLQWRRDILAGTVVGPPRQIFSMPLEPGAHRPPLYDAAEFDRAKQAGADMLKVWQMGRVDYFAFAAQARRVGLPFGGHIGPADTIAGSVTAEEISDSGARIIDHIGLDLSGGLDTLCVRNPKRPEYQRVNLAACHRAAEHLRRNGTWWVPTLMELLRVRRGLQFAIRPQSLALVVSYNAGGCDADIRADTTGLLAIAYRAGMPFLAGTDVGAVREDGGSQVAPQGTVHRELALLVSEGLSPLAALQAATLNPAMFLHATDSLGTVAPGKLADLVLLDDDPLVQITNTTHVWGVVANGRYLKGERPCHGSTQPSRDRV